MIYLLDHREQLMEDGIIGRDEVLTSWQTKTLRGLITHRVEVAYRPALDVCAYFGMRDPSNHDAFYLYKVTSRTKSEHTITLTGVHKLFDDLKGRGYLRDFRPKNAIFGAVMGEILSGSGWLIGKTTVRARASNHFYYVDKLTAFWRVLEAWDCEFSPRIIFDGTRIVRQYIDFAPQFAPDMGRVYAHGDRLLTVEAQSSEDAIATAFLGRGKGEAVLDEQGQATGGYGRRILFDSIEWSKAKGDPVDKPRGQPWVELPDRTQAVGYASGQPRLAIVEFPDIEDPAELLKATYQHALTASRPRVQYRAEVTDDQPATLGEKVWIKNKKLGIAYQTRVFEMERSFLSPLQQSIRFGDPILQSRASQQIQQKREAARKEEEVGGYIDTLAKQLEASWKNEDGFNYELKAGNPYQLPAGYYSFDRPIDQNPAEVVGISAGKLVIANSKNPDGSWRFTTFGTGTGFSASLINAGTIRGGNAYWNLETGELNLGGDFSYSPGTGLVITGSAKDQLKGEKGDRGETGSPGKDGAGGAPGIPGKDGLPGKDGKDGLPGKDGKDGSPGRGVARIVQEYVTTDENDASAPSGGWVSSPPREITGKTVWRRLATTFSDGSLSYTTPERLTDQQIVQAQLEAYRHTDAVTEQLQTQIARADYADKAYIDGVLDDLEQEHARELQRKIDALRDALKTDSERMVAAKVGEIESRLKDLEGYIWMDGNVIYIGQKNHFHALQLTNKQVSLLEQNRVRAYLNQQTLSAEQVKAYQLEFRRDGNEKAPIYIWRTRRVGNTDHLTLYYAGN